MKRGIFVFLGIFLLLLLIVAGGVFYVRFDGDISKISYAEVTSMFQKSCRVVGCNETAISGSNYCSLHSLEKNDINAGNTADREENDSSEFYSEYAITLPAASNLVIEIVSDEEKTAKVAGLGKCELRDFSIPTEVGGYRIIGIKEGAFYDCAQIRKLEIPGNVASIGDSAFENCTSLESLKLLPGVAAVGNAAFMGCSGLESIVLPEGLRLIGNFAFNGCRLLEEAIVPDSVFFVGAMSFGNCERLKNLVVPEEISYKSGSALYTLVYQENYDCYSVGLIATNNAKSIRVPTSVRGVPVRMLSEGAFYDCDNLREVVIPEGMEFIFSDSFKNCSKLERVYMPDTVSYISDDVLTGCDSFVSVCVYKRSNKTYAENWAVGQMVATEYYNLTEEDMVTPTPSSSPTPTYTPTPTNTPTNSPTPTRDPAIRTPIPNPYELPYAEGLEYVFDRDGYCIITGIGTCKQSEFTLPPFIDDYKVYAVSEQAFWGNLDIFRVIIPKEIREIGASAFADCSNIYEIDFSEGLEAIGDSAFSGCSGLWSMELPESLKNIGVEAFRDCSMLMDVVIPKQVSELKAGTFMNCSELRRLAMFEGVTRIGPYCFFGCKNLTSIGLSPNINKMGPMAFGGCDRLKELAIPYGVSTYTDADSLYVLEYDNLFDCYSIGLLYAGRMDTVKIPEAINGIPIMAIMDYAFYGCKELTSLALPEGITRIGSYAFSNCTSLSEIVIPESVRGIGDHAFEHCNRLSKVFLSEGVKSIGNESFRLCTALKIVEFPASLTTVGNRAFELCENLETIVFTHGVNSIEIDAFRYCRSIKNVYVGYGSYAENWARQQGFFEAIKHY